MLFVHEIRIGLHAASSCAHVEECSDWEHKKDDLLGTISYSKDWLLQYISSRLSQQLQMQRAKCSVHL